MTRDLHFSAPPPLSLYVHIPWCERKCPYCDFNSHPLRRPLPGAEYVDALLKDLDQELPDVWGRRVDSIFIGGGTPSLLDAQSMETLLSGIRARIGCRPGIEITLEANPGSSSAGKFRAFRDAGVNRLSIGVQSFDNDCLKRIGRIHDAREAARAVDAAVRAGFDNFNLDLMYALPGQTAAMAQKDLRAALGFSPPHLSYYQLTIEPNTWFHAHPPPLPPEDTGWLMQRNAERLLPEHGLHNYEVSAFAKPGRECRHNLNYWRFGDYLGIGAGAHGKLTIGDHVLRRWKVKSPGDYLKKAGSPARIGGETRPSAADLRFEFMLNAMRLTAPVPISLFQAHTGQAIATVKHLLAEAQRVGLIEFDGRHVAATSRGRRFLNDLLQRFLPEPDPAAKPQEPARIRAAAPRVSGRPDQGA